MVIDINRHRRNNSKDKIHRFETLDNGTIVSRGVLDSYDTYKSNTIFHTLDNINKLNRRKQRTDRITRILVGAWTNYVFNQNNINLNQLATR